MTLNSCKFHHCWLVLNPQTHANPFVNHMKKTVTMYAITPLVKMACGVDQQFYDTNHLWGC